MLSFNKCCRSIYHFSESTRIVWRIVGTNRFIGLRQPLTGMLHQQIVIRTGHTDIHIVIPRDESLMTHGTEHGSCPEIITQIVIFAYLVNGLKYFQNMQLQGPYFVICHNFRCFYLLGAKIVINSLFLPETLGRLWKLSYFCRHEDTILYCIGSMVRILPASAEGALRFQWPDILVAL